MHEYAWPGLNKQKRIHFQLQSFFNWYNFSIVFFSSVISLFIKKRWGIYFTYEINAQFFVSTLFATIRIDPSLMPVNESPTNDFTWNWTSYSFCGNLLKQNKQRIITNSIKMVFEVKHMKIYENMSCITKKLSNSIRAHVLFECYIIHPYDMAFMAILSAFRESSIE